MLTERVSAVTLDALCRDIPNIRLIKMDLEGSEELALRGATAVLGKTDLIIYESIKMFRNQSDRVPAILNAAGFKTICCHGNNCLALRETAP